MINTVGDQVVCDQDFPNIDRILAPGGCSMEVLAFPTWQSV